MSVVENLGAKLRQVTAERDCYREALEHIVKPNVHDRIETARRALSAASGDPVSRETTPPSAELEQEKKRC